jgi:hypothetical protein
MHLLSSDRTVHPGELRVPELVATWNASDVVIPANAGIHLMARFQELVQWIPAFAGMTTSEAFQ